MGDDLKTLVGLLDAASDLTALGEDTNQKIHQLNGVIRRQPIDHKRGSIGG